MKHEIDKSKMSKVHHKKMAKHFSDLAKKKRDEAKSKIDEAKSFDDISKMHHKMHSGKIEPEMKVLLKVGSKDKKNTKDKI